MPYYIGKIQRWGKLSADLSTDGVDKKILEPGRIPVQRGGESGKTDYGI